ncbi:methyltransferase domain-containing protein [Roseofilum casamattae]|uniref:Methyltransferase domain-containing protein n=1 Tax=Roseofilum casamattae BLCC-M143 TaxID=3022442 RepID=A0ABT7BTQ8_9CYAN|nr:methyltransferase domain-containing protein [Roseofilum casamattae]MDJ1182182.1 methyltransferase domain-containing protein [Roseofilum casamattae BLCC-M143]
MNISVQLNHWQKQAELYKEQGEYAKAVAIYEEAISTQPEMRSHYWNLGLLLLLQGQETDAQSCWLSVMLDGKEYEVEQWTEELVTILENEAQIQYQLGQYDWVWLIRQHIGQLSPKNISNFLYLFEIGFRIDYFSLESLVDLLDKTEICQHLRDNSNYFFPIALIEMLLGHLSTLETDSSEILEFTAIMQNEYNRATSIEDYAQKATILLEQGQFQEAEEIYRLAISTNVRYPKFYLELARLLQYVGKLEEADKYYDRAIDLAPNWAVPHYFKAINIKSAIAHNSQEKMEQWYSNSKIMEYHSCKEQFQFYQDVIQLGVSRGLDYDRKTIADVGCGFGQLLLMLGETYSLQWAKGFDFSMSAVKQAQLLNNFANCEFEQNDIYEGVKQIFDVVFCIEVLEHLLYPKKALDNLLHMISKGGVLIITVPNGRVDTFAGHINFWSPESWDVFICEHVTNCEIETGVMRSDENRYHMNFAIIKKK